MRDLFYDSREKRIPMAFKMRPSDLEGYVGQEEVVGEDGVLYKILKNKKLVNSIFYGPPGSGKTTLAEIISNELDYFFETLNATNASTSDIKKLVAVAENRLRIENKPTVLFLDEIHRFNKLQQDSLLPSTEKGVLILIGATTENPYYSLNNSLLSRCMLFEFKKLTDREIKKIIKNALAKIDFDIDNEIVEYITSIANGDARRGLNYIELIINSGIGFTLDEVKKVLGNVTRPFFDKEEDKYNTISALIKSIRGSDPDAAVYWLARLLVGGEDPRYIARRLIIHAAEDVGLANPDALNLAHAALTASERIGMPEIRIILSEVVIYLAISSKSNSSYLAIDKAINDIENGKILEVPKHLRNEKGSKYIYPHDFQDNFVIQDYLPSKEKYYEPGENRNEQMIKEKLKKLWG